MTYNVFSGTLNPTQSINLQSTACFGIYLKQLTMTLTNLRYLFVKRLYK